MAEDEKTIKTLFVTVLAEVIGFGILIPVVPLLFADPGSSFFILPEQYSIQTGYILLGLLLGLYPLAQFVATPLLGELSDVYGRKIVIQISIIGTVVSTLVFTYGLLVANLWLIFASRLINGLTGGLIAVAQATIADISNNDEKSRNFGIISAAFGTGLIIGPFLGGLLSSGIYSFLTITTPFLFAAGLSSLSLVYITLHLEETSPKENKSIKWSKPFSQVVKGVKLPGLQKLFAANFFYYAGFAFFTSFIPVLLIERFNFSQLEIGNFFLYIGVLILFTQLVLVRKLFPRFSEEFVMPKTVLMAGLFLLLLAVAPNLWIFLLLIGLFSFNNGINNVTLDTLVSKNALEEDQGLAMGTTQSLRSLANAFPSMLSGVTAALFTPATPIVVAGLLIFLTGVVYKLTE